MIAARTKDINTVKMFRENLLLAANKILGINLPWWQRYWIKGISRASISYIIAARGAGKTHTIALFCLLRAILFPKERVGIMSNSYRQAQLIFNEVVRMLEASPHAMQCVSYGPVIGTNKCHIKFQNGSTIDALPLGDGSKIRSSRFHTLVVDEFQDMDQEIVDAVILPFLNVQKNPVTGMLIEAKDEVRSRGNRNKNRLIITSTARYKYDEAYNKFQFIKSKHDSGDENYFCSIINLDDLRTLPGWLNEEIITFEQETMSKTRFLMENYGVWADTGEGFFDPIACENMKSLEVQFLNEKRDGCYYVIGVDPAKSSSNFTIYGLEWDGKYANLFYARAFTREEVSLAVGEIKYLQSKFDALVYMDARGGGIWVADQMTQDEIMSTNNALEIVSGIPTDKIILVQTAHPLIDNMNWALKAGIEGGKIRVPASVDHDFTDKTQIMVADMRANEINELIKELQSIVQKKLEKEIQYTTENKNELKDRYCAFMYAYWGIFENYINVEDTQSNFFVFTL